VLPTNHAFHETLEVTRGVTSWFEVGFYVFTSLRGGEGWSWVGDHIRPRLSVPTEWKWPVGLSLSVEAGYQRRQFSEDTWTLELRPIVDRKLGRLYLSFNPTLDRSLHGPSSGRGLEFSPNFKVSLDLSQEVALGLEYYGSLGPLSGFDPVSEQQHQIFPTLDLNVSPRWELNAGLGLGLTHATDHLILKAILGYRFGRGRPGGA
jgi:hypothetical protein